ncbi:hypothetical protein [Pedobacter metabolipauper]|uniref:Uncharacterized protein n=1 Tax=Pedobacter metabolipauper TaxID=425513 RepID=A0A4R6T4C2_9SPHI|nr:hypothetical protein [Pedobacter metabolipauper]TDQ12803.1 hypothetical protein ATK78_0010 [Pedobacter metabolipauper]
MKISKKQRIKELESKVEELDSKLKSFMEFVGYEGFEYGAAFENNTIKNLTINISK